MFKGISWTFYAQLVAIALLVYYVCYYFYFYGIKILFSTSSYPFSKNKISNEKKKTLQARPDDLLIRLEEVRLDGETLTLKTKEKSQLQALELQALNTMGSTESAQESLPVENPVLSTLDEEFKPVEGIEREKGIAVNFDSYLNSADTEKETNEKETSENETNHSAGKPSAKLKDESADFIIKSIEGMPFLLSELTVNADALALEEALAGGELLLLDFLPSETESNIQKLPSDEMPSDEKDN